MTHMGLLAFQYMSASRMQATSDDNVSRRVNKITTIIHGMVETMQKQTIRAQQRKQTLATHRKKRENHSIAAECRPPSAGVNPSRDIGVGPDTSF
ncbi:hypothetical protein AVEN_118770-1 [Araneus ventricosus]|uniref:Uncharacterized protein n=1 Tax=Araneus ventricosus TaxID=182803 RepID=A0A4Y2BVK6_ARAVE|nr:hypothetical protein AVEN_118770-1 [Araneus ventricosus]